MKKEVVLTEGEERKTYVRHMFNAIARRYDLLNHLLSFGVDICWRKQAIAMLDVEPQGLVLDLACGTGDFAMETIGQKKCEVIGADIAQQMLVYGNIKKKKKPLGNKLHFANADGERLPFRPATFEGATIAFGIRNMGSMDQALTEMSRVLKDKGQLIVLEFSLPEFKPFRSLYLFYFKHILPRVGGLISGDAEAYSYLPLSVSAFPPVDEFAQKMKNKGFSEVSFKKLLYGVAVIYKGIK